MPRAVAKITKPYASDELIIITGVDTVQKMAHFFNYKNGAPSPLHALPEGPKIDLNVTLRVV